eukprot:1126000-Lingulodinium_polyedra.AAC.1
MALDHWWCLRSSTTWMAIPRPATSCSSRGSERVAGRWAKRCIGIRWSDRRAGCCHVCIVLVFLGR